VIYKGISIKLVILQLKVSKIENAKIMTSHKIVNSKGLASQEKWSV